MKLTNMIPKVGVGWRSDYALLTTQALQYILYILKETTLVILS